MVMIGLMSPDTSIMLIMAAVTLAFFLVVCYPLQFFKKLICDSETHNDTTEQNSPVRLTKS